MHRFKIGVAKLILLGAMLTLATPAAAARVGVYANAGHFVDLNINNSTVYTDQHSIENRIVSGSDGDLTRRDNGVVTFTGPASSATRFEIMASEPESSARAYADLSTGKLGAYAGTTPLGLAQGTAVFAERLTFSIPNAHSATITPLRFLVSHHGAAGNASGSLLLRAETATFN